MLKLFPNPTALKRSAKERPALYSQETKVAIVALYILATLGALGATTYSILEIFNWGEAFLLGGDSTSWAGLKCMLSGFAMICCGRWFFMLMLIAVDYFQRRTIAPQHVCWPKVSVVVPAYNEAKTIAATIESLLLLDYPEYEVIVVDDGSTDETLAVASSYAGQYLWGRIVVYRKPNGGKWTALNYAFHRSQCEIVVCIDADGIVDSEALRRGVARMADPKVDAVAGYIKVMNRTNLLMYCQALEYIVWNGALRIPQSQSGTVLCVPGPLGFFRRSTLEKVSLRFGKIPELAEPGTECGPFEGTTFAEDFDLTVAILMLGGRVEYEPNATCDTDAPDSMFALLNQRYRWCRGSLQAIRKCFSRARAEPSYRRFRLFSWLFISYIYDLMTFAFAMSANLIVLTLALSGTEGSDGTIFYAYAAIQIGFKAIISALFILIHREKLRLLFVVPLLELYGSFILGGALVISVIDEIRSEKMRW